LEDSTGFAAVNIPEQLFKKLESRIKGTKFTSVSNYVTYLLQEIVAETESGTGKEGLTKEEEEAVKQRLRALGYIE
jgi:Arc/MetJ-type ribon-helix-helix transcriptional regulator